ncbi:hypothetical protein TUM4261_17760 [Shewanella sp. c952]|nr:hypothetical protein TUM4261_17760 [Shewanella sp. c952]
MALVFPASALPSAITGEDIVAKTDSARANFFMAFQLLIKIFVLSLLGRPASVIKCILCDRGNILHEIVKM